MMQLSIDNLRQLGAFTGAPVEREVTWNHNGEDVSVNVYVRPLSFQSAVADMQAAFGKSDDVAARMFAGRIATCIVNPDGTPVFTVDIIMGTAGEQGALSGNLARALWDVIAEVNHAGKTKS